MEISIEQYETIKTVRLHKIVINQDDYPELKDMSEESIKKFIDENIYSMKAKNSEVYSSLGGELDDDYVSEDCPAPDYDDLYISFIK